MLYQVTAYDGHNEPGYRNQCVCRSFLMKIKKMQVNIEPWDDCFTLRVQVRTEEEEEILCARVSSHSDDFKSLFDMMLEQAGEEIKKRC